MRKEKVLGGNNLECSVPTMFDGERATYIIYQETVAVEEDGKVWAKFNQYKEGKFIGSYERKQDSPYMFGLQFADDSEWKEVV